MNRKLLIIFILKYSNFYLLNILIIILFVVKCNLLFVGWFQFEYNLFMFLFSYSYIQAFLFFGNVLVFIQIEEIFFKVKLVVKFLIIFIFMRIGFLGLGIMGQGMVMNLLRLGYEVIVWNRIVFKVSLVIVFFFV